jgi:hypothetical protein
MIRKLSLAALLVLGSAAMTTARADAPLSPETVKIYANQIGQAFPGTVDIHLVGDKDFQVGHADINDVRVIGCSEVAGMLFFVIRMPNGTEMFIPQSQILAIHNRK